MQSADGIKQLAIDPAYIKTKQEVVLLRKNFAYARQGAWRWAGYGATIGALGTLYKAYQEEVPESETFVATGIVSTGGAALGAALGATIGETKRRYALWKINSALRVHTTYDFMKMPSNDAIMVVAAYQKNVPLMRKMMPQVHHFLKRKGGWEVLAQLYFGVSSSEQVNKLKEALETAE